MRARARSLALSCVLIGCGTAAGRATAQEAAGVTRIPEVERAPTLQELLSDAPPVAALRIDDFVQRQPGDGEPASERTVAYLFHDRTTLYAVFVCQDREPQKVRARLTKREAAVPDDLVGLLLDTFHDRRRAYLFLANPRGMQRDAIVTDGQGEDFSFDTLWESHGVLTPTGYLVSMAIPFKSLRFAPESDVWGVGVTRRIPRTTEEVYWPFVSRRREAMVPQLAPVSGFRNLSPGRNVELVPYGTFTNAGLRPTAQGAFSTARDAQGGADVKLVLADRVTLDLTANPDFSQVESDDPQVTINQRYEVYFPEKRPFFLERADFFHTLEPLFFSRRIVSPRWGSRVTGKLHGWNVGTLVAEDRVAESTDAADRASVGVIRLQRDLGRESAAGALLTTRQTGTGRDHLAAADTRIRLTPRWTFQAQASGSWHDDASSDRALGTALAVELGAVDRHWTFVNRYLDRSPGFAAPLGFIQRTDIRQAVQVTDYRWRPRSSALVAFGPGITSSMTWDYRGRPLDRVVNPRFGFEFSSATQVLVSGFANRETFGGRPFDIRAAQVQASSSWLKWLDVAAFYQIGERINYAPAAAGEPFVADTHDAFARIALRPNARVTFEETYIFTRLDAKAPPAATPDGHVFTNHLARSKVSVQMTRALSVRVIGDYGDVAATPALTAIESRRRATADVLATYQVTPFTAVHLGYTGAFDDLGEIAGEGRRRGGLFELPAVSRQLFLKVSYGIRF